MFKSSLAILLLVALIGSNLSVYFVYAGFTVNQKEIAATLCVNKSRPWMHCNGKCYLMKKLKQAEDKEKKQERDNQRTAFTLGLPAQPVSIGFSVPRNITIYHPLKTEKPVSSTSSIFQPPKINC